jgi:ribosomal protein S18 acetylase RimI-like enzyme
MEGLVEVFLPDDLDVLHAIDSSVVEVTPNILATGTHEEFLSFLRKGGRPITYILKGDGEQDVGLLALVDLVDSSSLEIRDILVKPGFQRMGYGRELAAEAESVARQLEKDSVILVTSPYNEDALSFYKAIGYELKELVEDYYGDGTPRYILVKYL